MEKINFENLPSTNTPINATNLNQLQTNIENVFNGNVAMENIMVGDIECKNLLRIYDVSNAPYGSFDNSTDKITLSTNHLQTTFLRGIGNYILKANQPYTVTIFLDKLSTTASGDLLMRFDNINKELAHSIYFNVREGSLIKSYTFVLEDDLEVGRIGFSLVNAGITFKIVLEKGNVKSKEYVTYKNFGYETRTIDNVNWIKYDDGTLEYHGIIPKEEFKTTSSYSTIVQNLTIYRSYNPNIVFPIPFKDENINVTIGVNNATANDRLMIPRYAVLSSSEINIQLLALEDFIETGIAYQNLNSVSWRALGKWK